MFSSLLSALRVGPVELPNRIVSTAHQTTLVHDHLPNDDFVAYHEARARGGVGLIVLEATAVDASGLLTSHTLGGYLPEIVDGYRRVAAAVRPHGTHLFVQLFHGGREQIASAPRAPALAPSSVPSQRFRTEPRALRPEEIERIVSGYSRSAALAAEAGLDGVEVSAAHRYLVEQFFDPALNRREDEWAGGRRFLQAVLGAVRTAAPGLCLGVRVSGDSGVGLEIAETAAAEGVDYLSVALGDSSTYLGSVGIVPPPPIEENAVARHAEGFRLGPPLIASSRIVDPERADRLIGDGTVDAVGMTRALIADPDLPVKVAAGRRILRCIGCNACIAHYHAGTSIACAVNPRTGRELSLPRALPGALRGRLVVVGGGPAGLAASVEAGEAGHDVVLLERTARLGGQMALTRDAPGAAEIGRRLLDLFEARLADGRVEVRLDTDADVHTVLEIGPAAVVVATGARPFVPALRLEGVPVAQSWDVLAEGSPSGLRIVVADWGGDPSGLDVSEVLALAGNDVTLAVASVSAGEAVHQYRRNLYLQRLYRAGVEIRQHRALAGASAGLVDLANVFAPEVREHLPADLLVLAQGRVPEDELARDLLATGLRVEEAGDCLSPRSLEEAILEGTLAARAVLALA
ncbi:MAG TPA: FAD-dependent oxidoreductase [Gaiellaceae bacterium]|nr:FAD-dependent oxidoreductase [Gaiellaceae bacterium]